MGPSQGYAMAPVCSEPGQTRQMEYSHVRATRLTVEKRKCAPGTVAPIKGFLRKDCHLRKPFTASPGAFQGSAPHTLRC